MREHEVPTHLQAEDKVLLWFTFQQLVAITAVAALSYGAYRYAPVGPSEVRIVLAVLLGLAGIGDDRGEGGRPAVAPGGRRPPAVPAGSPALRRTPCPAGAPRSADAGQDCAEPSNPIGQEGQTDHHAPPQR